MTIDGRRRDELERLFERRCLTYCPRLLAEIMCGRDCRFCNDGEPERYFRSVCTACGGSPPDRGGWSTVGTQRAIRAAELAHICTHLKRAGESGVQELLDDFRRFAAARNR